MPLSPPEQHAAFCGLCTEIVRSELDGGGYAWNLAAYKQTCNEDSSIWLLRKGSTDLALLSGDSTDETMRAALCGRQARPRLQKLSHHGICTRYFSEYVQKILKPEILVVSVDETIILKIWGHKSTPCAPQAIPNAIILFREM